MGEEVTSLRDMLTILGTLSDDSLATPLTKAIQGFLRKCPDAGVADTKRFLSEMRDIAVYTGGANSFVMGVFWSILGDDRKYPPPCGGDPNKIGDWLAQWEAPREHT